MTDEKKPDESPDGPGFLDRWLGKGGRVSDPSHLSPFTVDNDRWDRRDYERNLSEIREFDVQRDKLCDAVDTGNGLWPDAYFAFKKVDPKPVDPAKIRPKYLINQHIMGEAMQLKEFEELRAYTPGDDVASVMACVTVEPTLENLHDKMKKEQELADQMEKEQQALAQAQSEQRDLDEMVKEWSEMNDPDDPENGEQAQNFQEQQAAMNAQVEKLREQLQQTEEQFEQGMNGHKAAIKQQMKAALDEAREEAESINDSASMWGMEAGTLQKMNAQQRMDLAKRLNGNSKFKKMAELFGPMQRLMWTEQKRKVYHAVDEVYDIENGNDLARVLPIEFLALDHDMLELDFYRRMIEEELFQFKLRGDERVAKGNMIVCLDNSGSMMGDNELWGKAVALCLLHLAKQQKRAFNGIHFGSPGRIKCYDFTKPEHFDTNRVIDYAEYFEGGGTDFVTPLSKAMDYLRAEHDANGAVKGDIVFITDGICGVPPNWLEEFVKERDRMHVTVWGLLIGNMSRKVEPLHTICNGRIANVKDLLSGGDVRELFGGV